jgi:UDP-2-acetamido-3-amino-2,3-dideoxy-glucuronate N-acetyltransferase
MAQPFVHPSAVIDAGAALAEDVKVWHFSHISEGASLGAGTSVGQNVFVARGVRVGAGVKIQNNVSLYEGVEVDDDVFLGPSCVFTNVINPRSFVTRKHEYRRTRVGRGASIGANATIVCGHDIGEYAFVGAGAVVTKDVKSFALVTGVPARQVGWMCRCGERLPESAGPEQETGDGERSGRMVCGACKARYNLEDDELKLAEAP